MTTLPSQNGPTGQVQAPPRQLTRSHARAAAAALIQAAAPRTVGPVTALILADCVDQSAAAPLRAIGLTDDDCRRILFRLWRADPPVPSTTTTTTCST